MQCRQPALPAGNHLAEERAASDAMPTWREAAWRLVAVVVVTVCPPSPPSLPAALTPLAARLTSLEARRVSSGGAE
jgi:hypothetical protein